MEDLDDDDDRVRDSEEDEGVEEEVDTERRDKRHRVRSDSIEVESDESGTSQEVGEEEKQEGEENTPPAEPRDASKNVLSASDWSRSPPSREAKRRKLSISPSPEALPTETEPDPVVSPYGSLNTAEDDEEAASEEGDAYSDIDDMNSDTEPAAKQPTFRAAPRFKPLDYTLPDSLPVAFSPQRRGAKYLSNGLAATLQGWLSDVKGWEGEDRPAESTFLVTITEVRAGRRMYLARARPQGETQTKRLVLAGEGELTGLGNRADVVVGSAVKVTGPLWDAEIEGVSWIVACNWCVQT